MTDQSRWKATVFVGGLAPMVTAANLEAAFLPFGEIADVSLPYAKIQCILIGHNTNSVPVSLKLQIQLNSTVAMVMLNSRIQKMLKMPLTIWISLSSLAK
jgi:RNA recognition motif-containing protein